MLRHLFLLLLLLSMLLNGCSEQQPTVKEQDFSSLIDYIPADTAFAYLFSEPLPPHIANHIFENRKRKLSKHLEGLLAEINAQAQARGSTGEIAPVDRLLAAAIQRLMSNFSREGLNELGINLDSDLVLYEKNGSFFLRMNLESPMILTDTIASIFEDAQVPLDSHPIDDGWYYMIHPNGESTLAMGVLKNHLVLSIAPYHVDDVSSFLLPGTKFTKLSRKRLAFIAQENGYSHVALGFADTRRILDLLRNLDLSGSQELLNDIHFHPRPIPASCNALLSDLAGKAPLLHAGVVSADDQGYVTQVGISLDAPLADAVHQMGNGSSLPYNDQAMAALSLSLNLPKARLNAQQALSYLDAHEECEWFSGPSFDNFRSLLDMISIPMLNQLKGLSLHLVDLSVSPGTKKLEHFEGSVIFSVESSAIMLSALSTINPMFGQLGITIEGDPVKIDLPSLPKGESAFIGASARRIGIAFGPQGDSALDTMLKENPVGNEASLSYSYKGNKIVDLFDKVEKKDKKTEAFLDLIDRFSLIRGDLLLKPNGVFYRNTIGLNTSDR